MMLRKISMMLVGAKKRLLTHQPTLECLEGRTMLSTVPLIVNSLADSGVGTLRAEIGQANAGAATNQYVITFAARGTIDLLSALPALNNNIAINGLGAKNLTVQRDPNAADFSIFTVDSGVTVSLSGMTITGGNAVSGGGINNFGTLVVTNSVFTNNLASNYGGGISYTGGLPPIGGGGIDNEGGTLVVNNSTFTSNASFEGGGILNSYSGTATVNNSIFAKNSSRTEGGGIYNISGTLTIYDSNFTSNTVLVGGGGLYSNGATTVMDSTFANNSAVEEAGAIGNGSVEYLSVYNSIFTDNSASYGGAIANLASATFHAPVMVYGCIFIGNTAMLDTSVSSWGGDPYRNGNGGAVFNEGSLTIEYCILADNSATNGGGIYNDTFFGGNTLIDTRNLFFDNTGGNIN